MSQDVVSFVLRFVRETGEAQQARWRGTIKHVQGSTERQFTSFAEALRFMQEHTAEVVMDALQDSAELGLSNPLVETARLWGEFIPRYNQLLMDKLSETMQKSSSQFEELTVSFNPWLTLADKGNRVAELEAKVTELEATIEQLKTELHRVKNAAKPHLK
jgi:uncharacterized protein YecA (UPF0149 family)